MEGQGGHTSSGDKAPPSAHSSCHRSLQDTRRHIHHCPPSRRRRHDDTAASPSTLIGLKQEMHHHKTCSWERTFSSCLLFVPLSQKRPPQPVSQLHCQGCWQKPWRQPGIGTQRSHCSPSHPGSHLQTHTSHVTIAGVRLGWVWSFLSKLSNSLISPANAWFVTATVAVVAAAHVSC